VNAPLDYLPATPGPITPAPYAAPPQRDAMPPRPRPGRWAFAGIIAVLALALTQLPWRTPPQQVVPPRDMASPDRAAGPSRTPRDADTTRTARSATQAALAATLERTDALLRRGAERWARADMHTLETLIAAGEKAYREARYADARTRFAQADALVAALEERVPALTTALVERGELALAQGDSAAAAASFERALTMVPGHAAAREGHARAATLDQVLALLGQAAGNEQRGDIDKALAAYRQALAIDAAAPGAASALQRIEREQRGEAFRDSLGAGLGALAKRDFAAARKALARAAELDATNPELLAALAHLERAEQAARIERALARGEAATRAERWADAVEHYERALADDDTLADARAARDTARGRARLDAALGSVLAAPKKLVDDEAHAAATRLLARARRIAAPGARLSAQLARLEHTLALARTPVPVRLRSDGVTTVHIEDVGTLGSFATRTLSLRPGLYVARGTRDGHAAVRVEFELAPGSAATDVSVICPDAARPATE